MPKAVDKISASMVEAPLDERDRPPDASLPPGVDEDADAASALAALRCVPREGRLVHLNGLLGGRLGPAVLMQLLEAVEGAAAVHEGMSSHCRKVMTPKVFLANLMDAWRRPGSRFTARDIPYVRASLRRGSAEPFFGAPARVPPPPVPVPPTHDEAMEVLARDSERLELVGRGVVELHSDILSIIGESESLTYDEVLAYLAENDYRGGYVVRRESSKEFYQEMFELADTGGEGWWWNIEAYRLSRESKSLELLEQRIRDGQVYPIVRLFHQLGVDQREGCGAAGIHAEEALTHRKSWALVRKYAGGALVRCCKCLFTGSCNLSLSEQNQLKESMSACLAPPDALCASARAVCGGGTPLARLPELNDEQWGRLLDQLELLGPEKAEAARSLGRANVADLAYTAAIQVAQGWLGESDLTPALCAFKPQEPRAPAINVVDLSDEFGSMTPAAVQKKVFCYKAQDSVLRELADRGYKLCVFRCDEALEGEMGSVLRQDVHFENRRIHVKCFTSGCWAMDSTANFKMAGMIDKAELTVLTFGKRLAERTAAIAESANACTAESARKRCAIIRPSQLRPCGNPHWEARMDALIKRHSSVKATRAQRQPVKTADAAAAVKAALAGELPDLSWWRVTCAFDIFCGVAGMTADEKAVAVLEIARRAADAVGCLVDDLICEESLQVHSLYMVWVLEQVRLEMRKSRYAMVSWDRRKGMWRGTTTAAGDATARVAHFPYLEEAAAACFGQGLPDDGSAKPALWEFRHQTRAPLDFSALDNRSGFQYRPRTRVSDGVDTKQRDAWLSKTVAWYRASNCKVVTDLRGKWRESRREAAVAARDERAKKRQKVDK